MMEDKKDEEMMGLMRRSPRRSPKIRKKKRNRSLSNQLITST